MTRPHKTFHSGKKATPKLLLKTQVVLVRPERGGNVGAAARALSNMGVGGDFWLVDAPNLIDEEALRFAKHAKDRVLSVRHATSLREILDLSPDSLSLAASARTGSASRPNPLWVPEAIALAEKKFEREEIGGLTLVFGPEGSGLTNEEIECCDLIVQIPTGESYTSLNLSQAVLVFCYELRRLGLKPPAKSVTESSQKNYLSEHLVKFAKTAGFMLPGDPFKMRPQLEKLAEGFQGTEREIGTLHGLLAQAIRNLDKDVVRKGRYKIRAQKRPPNV